MKCIILLLTFVALCYSYPFVNTGGRSVNINEDGTIVINGRNGKRVTITKEIGISGQKNIEITISGPNIPTKRIQINDGSDQAGEYDVTGEYQRDKRSSKRRSQGDTLVDILKEYQGDIDDNVYDQLLKKVSIAVRNGLLNESVYDVLQGLRQSQYPGVGNIITGQDVNVLDLLQKQQQVEDLLQQQQRVQGGLPWVLGQQQIWPYGQSISKYGTSLQGGVVDVPVQTSQGTQIVERVLLGQPWSTTQNLIYGQRGIPGVSSRVWQRSVWDDLLNNYGTQQRGISLGQFGQQGTLQQIVQNER